MASQPQRRPSIRRHSWLRRRKHPRLRRALAGLLLRLWFVHHAARVAGDTLSTATSPVPGSSTASTASPQAAGSRPTLIRLPGYPLFLPLCFALFGMEHYNAVMYVQVVLDLRTCLLSALSAGRLFGRRAALAASGSPRSAPSPPTTSPPRSPKPSPFPASRSPSTPSPLAASALGSRDSRTTAGSGSSPPPWPTPSCCGRSRACSPRPSFRRCSGSACDRRPQGYRGASSRNPLPSLLTAFLILLPLAPWTLRNWRTFHVFQPLAPRYATDPGEPSHSASTAGIAPGASTSPPPRHLLELRRRPHRHRRPARPRLRHTTPSTPAPTALLADYNRPQPSTARARRPLRRPGRRARPRQPSATTSRCPSPGC